MEHVFFKHRRKDRPVNLEEYRELGGYTALAETLRSRKPAELCQLVADSGLRGRGGAGFPTGMKWKAIPESAPYPRYVVANSDEMEPGTFKDRMLVNADPHLVIEGMILAAYAVSASEGFFYVRPSYEKDAQLMEREVEAARGAGLLGKNILGSDFSFDITVHRSGGRYICGEVSALLQALHGRRPNPKKIPGIWETQIGLWGMPTLMNNAETLACVAPIIKNGPQGFKGLARTEAGIGNKLFCVSGRVRRPGCYELPMGTPLSEIIEEAAGGMPEGMEFKACLPGGASTRYLPKEHYHVPMDYDSLQKVGNRLGTSAIMVFDQNTCLVAATLNLMDFFVRESCGWCTPCREGLPFMHLLLWQLENGEGREEHIGMLRAMASKMGLAYCALAAGAAEPVLGLLDHFEEEVREHIRKKTCPFRRK
ncbi:MAG: NADH-ubiquinone oxidoreductase-F iron-sulfur binding region domain-containing protein [Deltaproteobacteria bacterium]